MKKVLLLIVLISNLTLGREILIGDRMDFEIKGVTMEEAAEAFEGFDVEELWEEDGRVRIGVRAYETGKKVVEVGNKRLIIRIKSSLEEGEDEIMENLTDKSDILLSEKKAPLLFYAGGSLLAISFGFMVAEGLIKIKKRKINSKSPEEKFYEGVENTGEDYVYEVSYLLREYIDTLTGSSLLLGRYEERGFVNSEVLEFLKGMDHWKFSKEGRRERAEVVEAAKKMAGRIEKKLREVEENA